MKPFVIVALWTAVGVTSAAALTLHHVADAPDPEPEPTIQVDAVQCRDGAVTAVHLVVSSAGSFVLRWDNARECSE